MIWNSVLDGVGKTPLISLNRLTAHLSLPVRLFGKAERFNPSGSVKDRASLSMLKTALQSGRLREGGVVISATSGNAGIGLSMTAAVLGLTAIIVMPENMSVERRRLLQAYGARIELSSASEGMKGAVKTAERLARTIENSLLLDQFSDMSNPEAHLETTAKEILEDLGVPDAFIAGIGSGGTISGTAQELKRHGEVFCLGVEPAEAPYFTLGQVGVHDIMGLGPNFTPDVLNLSLIDEIMPVSSADAKDMALLLARTEGLFCGTSSGAAIFAASKLAQRKGWRDKTLVAVLPDTGERYLSVL
ncbi:MAG: cysteine synthase family protein [Clostridia bacterium]|nr:cysteine synthase family protein [Clostridia bacterium]